MIQLFRLGQTMRRKYGDFATDRPEEVDLYPSERGTPCSSLSQCFVSGFYKPNKDAPPPKDPAWQSQNSIPDKPEETNLKCPKLQEAASRLYDDSEEGNKILEQYTNLYQFWSDNSGMQIRNPTDARELYENLQLEKGLNTSLPSWADRFWPELRRQSEIHFAWLAKHQNMQRMAAGPLLGLIIQRMQRHINGYDVQKYFVYSGKNSSLAGLLAMFGAFDGVEPSFGSTIVLELHRFGAVYYVRVLYFYSSDPHTEIPEIITLRGCSEYCPFEQFRLLTTGMVPLKWEQECGLWEKGGSSDKMLSCTVALVWFVLFLL